MCVCMSCLCLVDPPSLDRRSIDTTNHFPGLVGVEELKRRVNRHLREAQDPQEVPVIANENTTCNSSVSIGNLDNEPTYINRHAAQYLEQ